ncbi:MAG TPA: cache domain-containing protein [Burkholderiaceae bacterium]
MNRIFKVIGIAILALGLHTTASAEAKRTKEEAVAMVKRGAAYIKEVGVEKAMAEFNNPKGKFVDGSLYIFAYDMKGVNLASPNPKIVGKNMLNVKDQNGKETVKAYIAASQSPAGNGWVDFVWPHPQTKEMQQKSAYVERVGDVLIACGIYL